MGMHQQTHLGPYIEILGTLRETETKIERRCPQHLSIQQLNNKFCGICGTLIENFDVPITREISASELLTDNDEFWSPEGLDSILLPNDSPDDEIGYDNEEGGAINLFGTDMNDLMASQIEWLNLEYSHTISFFKEKCGNDNVQVRWGIVGYWS